MTDIQIPSASVAHTGGAPIHRPQRGIALVMVVASVAVAMVLGLSYLAVQNTALGITANMQHHERARLIAESGMEAALAYIRDHSDWRQNRTHGLWVANHAFDGGNFSIYGFDGIDADGNGSYDGDGDLASDPTHPATLLVVGRFNGSSHTVRAVVFPQQTKTSGGIAGGVASRSDIDMRGNPRIDAIDSRNTSYSPWSNGWELATVMTNAADTGSVDLRNSATIHGHIQVGVGGGTHTVTTSGIASVVGDINDADQPFDPPAISEPADLPPSQGAGAFPNWGSGTLTAGTYHYDSFAVTNNFTLYIEDHVTLFVAGNFDMRNGGAIILEDGATLTIYAEQFSILNNTRLNMNFSTAGNPARLTLYQTGTQTFKVDNSAAVVGQIVAPEADLKVVGNGRVFGSVVASSITMENSGRITQDMALSDSDGGDNGSGSSNNGGIDYRVHWVGLPHK